MYNRPISSQPSSTRELIKHATRVVVAHRGSSATSLRAVAAQAGISPALVNHHFGSRQALLDEVEREAIAVFGRAYQASPADDAADPAELLETRARQTREVMREHPDVCDFIGRRLAEGGSDTGRFVRRMLEAGMRETSALQRTGAVRADADPLWTTIQHFLLIWAPLTFRGSLESLVGAPLYSQAVLDAWSTANVDLLRHGLYARG